MRTMGLPYALPRDMEEINRLDFQHYMLRYALRGLYAAPLREPASILDVGTGTGRWAMDMAQLFPRTNVIGVDVNPPPADERAGEGIESRPPNYLFAPGNVLEGLPFAEGSFDFVHMRLLFTALPSDRWALAVAELARVTRPGGWVESVETTGLHNGGPSVGLMMTWIAQMSARRGVDLLNGGRVAHFMQASGLRNIAASVVNVPTGAWGGRLGAMVATDFVGVCKGYGGLLVGAGLTTQEQFDETLTRMRAEFTARNGRCYTPFYVAIGQK
ncbi:MAG TPA: methyltransferase domain-containing protein [Ktedonobacterales bacterium]|nr:methyltransferase domain-containing protein [Ktedonobacterales bacterium]